MKVFIALSILTIQILIVNSDYIFDPTLIESCEGVDIVEGKFSNLNGIKIKYNLSYSDLIPVLNVTTEFLTDVQSPWPVILTAERKENDKWTKHTEKNIKDACNKNESNFDLLAEMIVGARKPCPIKKGVSYNIFYKVNKNY